MALPLLSMIAWIQPLQRPPKRSPESVLAHHTIVQEAWRGARGLAPVRFGQWFSDRDALERALEPRRDELMAALERVAGAGEHVVRVGAEPESSSLGPMTTPSAEDTAPGRRHMEALAARERGRHAREARALALARELADHVGALARDARVQPLHEGGLVSVAYLVERGGEAAYGARVDGFAADHPGLRLTRAGPWPPYSFVP